MFWFQVKSIKPDMAVLPDLQSENVIKASSFGDDQFYFRMLAFEIQNAGDTFGRVTPLKDYDYKILRQWFNLLDILDSKSNFVPSLAAYYYSNTQNTPDVRYIIDYLVEHADKDPYNKWWWYSQAVYNAKYKLGDKKLALEISYKLAASPNPNIPMWTRQMPALILEDLGEKEEALMIARDILENYKDMPEGELNFMNYFIAERLEKMESGELK
jgi:tetratricopeptide (TPR) repeat protein